ncbi:MAG TPA: DUF1552 domain-containing protein [Polyangiaceae bacterium]|nr:DUF1552 domain-containing protein [Polyangiaceae bacterium]
MNPRPSRRQFLGGAAVALSLPFLPSLQRTARAADCVPPKRFMAWFVPNGMVMPDWTPTTVGTNWTMPTILAPLAPVRSKILVVSGLDHHKTAEPATPPNGHASGTGCFLNMIPVNGNQNNPNRTSVDQVLLPALNPAGCAPALPSLQLGLQGENGLCDQGPCIFSRAISWNKGTPLPCISDPQAAFDRMFMGRDPMVSDMDAARRRAERKSVLDRVINQAVSLKVKLSASDQQKLDQYLTQVRELELQIQNVSQGGAACTPPMRPAKSPPLNFDRGITPSTIISSHTPIFLDLMALAFECDITRSLTFMLGNGTSNNNYEFVVGSSAPHHGTSHHQGSAANIDKLRKIDVWEMTQVSTLLQRLDKTIEADGKSVLDHTTFYLGSDVSDGDRHNKWDMPVLVAGGGSLKADGRHINYGQMTFPRPLVGPRSEVHTGRLLVSMMRGHGIMTDTLGEAKGVLEEVLVA